jgi:hypothetical protein
VKSTPLRSAVGAKVNTILDLLLGQEPSSTTGPTDIAPTGSTLANLTVEGWSWIAWKQAWHVVVRVSGPVPFAVQYVTITLPETDTAVLRNVVSTRGMGLIHAAKENILATVLRMGLRVDDLALSSFITSVLLTPTSQRKTILSSRDS